MRVKRIEAVEAYISQVGSVSIQDLCEEFHVSINTIRRDIDTLVRDGRVKKVYGGVVALGQSESDATRPQTLEQENEQLQEDISQLGTLESIQKIAREVLDLVLPGTVFFGTGD